MNAGSALVERIQRNLELVRVTLWSSIGRILERGETAERIEQVSIAVAASSQMFNDETIRQIASARAARSLRLRRQLAALLFVVSIALWAWMQWVM